MPKQPESHPPALLTRTRQLRRAMDACSRTRVIGVDTESNSFWAYRERVCVIQLFTGKQYFLIDPLALEDLSLLGTVFHDPGIVKVFHGADYDLRCLWRDFRLRPAPIFDTMVAASLLDYPALGLGALVERHFGVHLPKTNALTRYDWARRPLPDAHMDYLVNDVRYLVRLWEILLEELRAKDLVEEAEWELRQLEQATTRQLNSSGTEGFFSIKGSKHLEPLSRTVLKRLYEFREACAQQSDQPRFKVLSNRILLEVAKALPRSRRRLRSVPGLTPGLLQRYGEELLDAVRRGQEDFRESGAPVLPEKKAVRGPQLDRDFEIRLKQWRAGEAQRRGVSPQAVLPTACLKDIARAKFVDSLTLSQIPGMIPKRRECYGKIILDLYAQGTSEQAGTK